MKCLVYMLLWYILDVLPAITVIQRFLEATVPFAHAINTEVYTQSAITPLANASVEKESMAAIALHVDHAMLSSTEFAHVSLQPLLL